MIKMLRVDDNLLHGQVAFSWVYNLRLHTIIIADDRVVNDQFMKMTLGLSKPTGVNLIILSMADAIDEIKKHTNDNLNVLVIVKTVSNAYNICKEVNNIKHINLSLVRKNNEPGVQYEMMYLTKDSINKIKELIKNNIEIEYRLRYEDSIIYLNDIIENISNNVDNL